MDDNKSIRQPKKTTQNSKIYIHSKKKKLRFSKKKKYELFLWYFLITTKLQFNIFSLYFYADLKISSITRALFEKSKFKRLADQSS